MIRRGTGVIIIAGRTWSRERLGWTDIHRLVRVLYIRGELYRNIQTTKFLF